MTFRGPVTSFLAAERAAEVTWDAEECELVLTFPRSGVEWVRIKAPESAPEATPPAVE